MKRKKKSFHHDLQTPFYEKISKYKRELPIANMFDALFTKLTSLIKKETSFPPILFVGTSEYTSQHVHELAQKLCTMFEVSHHQIHTFSQSESIKISELRDFFQASFLRSSERFSIFIIENIDTATLQALNSSLKIFEEPGKGNIIFLTARETGNIPETILSRVQIMDTKTVNISEKNSFFEAMIHLYFTKKDTEIFSHFFASKNIEKEEYLVFLDILFSYLSTRSGVCLLEKITKAKEHIGNNNGIPKYEVDRILLLLQENSSM